jgi:hypothetical protein
MCIYGMWPWKVPKWPWFWAEVAVKAWQDLSPVFKSRIYKLVGYVPYEISNSKKV